MVTGADVVNKARTYIGQVNSDGSDGNDPPNHPWAFFCEAFVEMVHQQLGLGRVRYETALAHAEAISLSPGAAPAGAMIFFGTDFFADGGHVAISQGDGSCVGTVTDGTGVGVRELGEGRTGYLGWAYHPGMQHSDAIPVGGPSAGWYQVDDTANIRPGPKRDEAPVGHLVPGTMAAYGAGQPGEAVEGDPWWLPLRDRRGWVHNSLLTLVCPPPGDYQVDDTANIRPVPGRSSAPVGSLAAGSVAAYGVGEQGDPVDGNPWWLPLQDGRGWVHSSLLLAV